MDIRPTNGFTPLQPGWSLPQSASGGPLPDSVQLSSLPSWSPSRPVVAATPAPPSPGSLTSTASETLRRTGISLLGWLAPFSEPAAQPPVPTSEQGSRLADAVRQGLVELEKASGRPAGAPEGKSGSVTPQEAFENIRAGRGAYLSSGIYCYNVKSLDEAGFFLFMTGRCSETELERPDLARSLKWLTEKGLCCDGALHSEIPLRLYQGLKAPEHSVEIHTPEQDRKKSLSLGHFSAAEMEPFEAFLAKVEPELAAATIAERHGDRRNDIWTRIHKAELDHHEADIVTRAQAAAATCRLSFGADLGYQELLRLAREHPLADLVKFLGDLPLKSGEQAVQALAHFGQVSSDKLAETMRRVEDLDLALTATHLARSPERAEQLEKLQDVVLRKEVARDLIAGWAARQGEVDVEAGLEKFAKERDFAPHVARMWSELPIEQHGLCLQLMVRPSQDFEETRKALAAVNENPTRAAAWLAWNEELDSTKKANWRAEQATRLLEGWTGSDLARDGPDFARVLSCCAGDPDRALAAWTLLQQSPDRDLGLAVLQATGSVAPAMVDRLVEQGFKQQDRPAGVRFLVEQGVGLEASMDATSLLSGRQRPLGDLLQDYKTIRNQIETLPNADARTRVAMRQAFELGPRATESLAAATRACWDLTRGLELLPLLEQPGREEHLANLECAGWLAAGDQGRKQQTAQYFRLLQAAGAGPEQRAALAGPLKGSKLAEVEDFLGLRAGEADDQLTRIGRSARLLGRAGSDPEATAEIARRLGGADWTLEAGALLKLGPAAEEVARQLGSPEALRTAAPLLYALGSDEYASRGFTALSTPVGQESFAERCQAALSWLQACPGDLKEATEDWAALTARLGPGETLADTVDAGVRLRAMLGNREDFRAVVERLHALGRWENGPRFSEAFTEFTAAASRLGPDTLFGKLDVEAVLAEMSRPGATPAQVRSASVLEEAGQVTLPGVRLRKRS